MFDRMGEGLSAVCEIWLFHSSGLLPLFASEQSSRASWMLELTDWCVSKICVASIGLVRKARMLDGVQDKELSKSASVVIGSGNDRIEILTTQPMMTQAVMMHATLINTGLSTLQPRRSRFCSKTSALKATRSFSGLRSEWPNHRPSR